MAKTKVITEGSKAPNFAVDSTVGQLNLSKFKGKKLVLYFYPKDDTSGCTLEAKDFTDNLKDYEMHDCNVVGISKDDLESHEKFCKKHDLKIILATDSSDVCEKYGVWKEKSMYGKKYMGIERSTFLIDRKGVIAKVWNNVNAQGHSEEVLSAVRAMQ